MPKLNRRLHPLAAADIDERIVIATRQAIPPAVGAGKHRNVNEELRYVLLGALISIPLSIVAPFGTELVKQYFARRNQAAKGRRIVELRAELARLENWNNDRSSFHTYLIARLVLALLVETLIAAITSAIGAGNNSIWANWRASDRYDASELVVTDWTSAAAEALWFIGCIAMFRLLYTAYRNYMKIRDIEGTRKRFESQIASLPDLVEPGIEKAPN
ncbi:hypothetical protein [Micromonospora profundi]|uniref:hypothetical protein n=1 Tax=Micromonospora profundi TaxID=1420889 RepID=UPI00365B2B51